MMTAEKKPKVKLPPGVEVEKSTKAFKRAERKVFRDGVEIGFVRRESMHGWIPHLKDAFYEHDKRWYGQPIYHDAPKGKWSSLQGFDTEAEAVARLVEADEWGGCGRLAYIKRRDRQRSIGAANQLRARIKESNDIARGWYERITDDSVRSMDLARAMDKLREAHDLAEQALRPFKEEPTDG